MDSEKSTSRPGGAIRVALGILTTLHCILHVILFIAASIAWSTLRKRARMPNCVLAGGVDCGAPHWVIYSFITPVALICALVLGLLAVRKWARTKGAHVDPLYVFRGVVLTTLLLAPFICLNWFNWHFNFGMGLSVVNATDPADAFMLDPATASMFDPAVATAPTSFGFSGSVFLEMLTKVSRSARAAWGLTWFNVLFGAFVAGISAALASPTRGGAAIAQNPAGTV